MDILQRIHRKFESFVDPQKVSLHVKSEADRHFLWSERIIRALP